MRAAWFVAFWLASAPMLPGQAEAQPKKPAVDACPDGMYRSSDTRQCEPIKGPAAPALTTIEPMEGSKSRMLDAESLQSPVTASSSPEEARVQLECWAKHRGGPQPYANYALCTADLVAAAVVNEFGSEGNFLERYLAFRLETYRSIDSRSHTMADAQRLRESVLAAERQNRQFRALEAQGYRCSQVGPTQVQCTRTNPNTGNWYGLSLWGAGVTGTPPPPPPSYQCATNLVGGYNFIVCDR